MRKPVRSRHDAAAKRRRTGMAQNIVIFALVISAVALLWLQVGSGQSVRLAGAGAAGQGDGSAREYSAAADPMCIVITPEDGFHYAAMHDARSLNESYARYSAALAEALGSAGEPEAVSEEEWRAALEGSGVYFDYYADVQLSTLSVWLGSEMGSSAGTHSARRFCLSISDGEVVLYYLRERNVPVKTAYRCSTELSYSDLTGRVSESTPNGARFAFELDGELDAIDAYTVVSSEEISVHTVTGENSLDQSGADGLMAAFGLNSNLVQYYSEADGTDVYLEGSVVLRLGSNGVLRFTNRSELSEPAADLSPADAVELSRRLLESTAGGGTGVASLRLTYIYFDSSQREYTLRYDYEIGGLAVSLQGSECAAEIRVSGAAVTYADIIFRSYSYTGGTERPLPSRLAAAIVQAGGGGEPRLTYMDTYGSVAADWIVV